MSIKCALSQSTARPWYFTIASYSFRRAPAFPPQAPSEATDIAPAAPNPVSSSGLRDCLPDTATRRPDTRRRATPLPHSQRLVQKPMLFPPLVIGRARRQSHPVCARPINFRARALTRQAPIPSALSRRIRSFVTARHYQNKTDITRTSDFTGY